MVNKRGFTLIELLIVVAIIGILAAIAVPNFLNAQMKAKIARVQADLRAMKTAIEMYALDNNSYPDACTLEFSGTDHQFRAGEIMEPIEYSSIIPIDPFNTEEGSRTSTFARNEYFYVDKNPSRTDCVWPGTIVDWTVANADGAPSHAIYVLASQGPDNLSEIQDQRVSPIFDATNGLISQGDIIVFGP
ncbi:pilin [bacterium]|nr:pilin [bacterium]